MNPLAFGKIIFSFFTMLAFVCPLIIISDLTNPWLEANEHLNKLHPNEFYLALESSSETKQISEQGKVFPDYKYKSYLAIPSNKTYQFYLEDGKELEVKEVENFTVTYIFINLILIILFFFGGLPILRDWANGKLLNKTVYS